MNKFISNNRYYLLSVLVFALAPLSIVWMLSAAFAAIHDYITTLEELS